MSDKFDEIIDKFIEDYVVTGLKRGAIQQKEHLKAELLEYFAVLLGYKKIKKERKK